MANSESTELKNLRERLGAFWGAKKEVANRSGFHRQYVRMVLLGERYNQEIIEVAYEVLLEHEQAAQKHRHHVNELQKKLRQVAQS